MVTAKTPGLARSHLVRLAVELRRRGWRATVTGTEHRVVLTVTNPAVPAMSERIVCGNSLRGWCFSWSWRQEIGPADNLTGAADKITDVLRADGR
jgi:hypothetical protein